VKQIVNCVGCEKEFKRNNSTHKYCSKECRDKYYKEHMNQKSFHLCCNYCGKYFINHGKRKYCSDDCVVLGRELDNLERRIKIKKWEAKYLKKPRKVNFTNFNNLRFWSEKGFAEWFKMNYVLYGISEILSMDRFFPDVLAKMFDGRTVRIELEHYSQNYISHNHPVYGCDLVISFVKPFKINSVKGIPIIAIFNAKGLKLGCTDYDPESLILTDHFQQIVEVCLSMSNRALNGCRVTQG